MRKDEQTHVPQSHNDFDRSFTYQVASFCNKCRWHFDVLIGFFHHVSERTLCGKANKDFPMHHFLFNGEKDEPVIDGIQSNSRTFSFQCSAPHCPIGLRIRVTPPRLTEEDVVLLTDQKVLRRRWEDAKRIDKNRAEDAMARRVDPVDFLNTYLQDSLNPVKGKTCIPFLNRKFLKTFGKDCDAILKKLGFTNVVELDAKGESTEVWYLPTPPAAQYPMEIKEPTPSERTVVDDARYELNTILLSFPEAERLATRRAPLDLAPSFGDIEELLGCADYVKAAGRATRSSNDAEDHPYYAGLGTVGDFADHYLLFAYHRQSTTDPSNAPYYFECIQDLAYGRQSNLLQQDVATLASEGRLSRREIFTAFRYFNIDTEQRETVSDDYIIGLFKSRLADIAPSMVGETRKHLRTIGYARDSESITRAASDTIETYEQALMWLDLDETQTDDLVIALSASKDDDPSSKEIARKAVDIIARHRNSQTLRDYLENSNMADYEQDVSDAYNFLNIADKRTSTIDLHVLESTVEVEKGLWPGNEKKYTNALRIVREDQEKMNINRQPKPQYPLATWPVGCSNIGNTCYLNSVLQFLFTIKPLRKMVLECEDYMQELTPEALETKKVGRTVVSLGRAETGQHCKFHRARYWL
jgi:ubiquitin carboxyl-terminal hydrolase 25/28